MRKTVVGGLAVGALMLVASFAAGDAWAQARSRGQRVLPPDVLMFQGPGSSIGASVRDLRQEEIAAAKVAQPGGVLVQDVRDGSPASRAGLRSGEIVVEFDGERVRGARQFTRLVRETPAGRSVRSSVVRDGARREVTITPDAAEDRLTMAFPDIERSIERGLRAMPRDFDFDFELPVPPEPPQAPGAPGRYFARGRLGLTLSPLSDQLATYFGVKQGVLVSSVAADSPASRAGIRAGDVITQVNGREVNDASDLVRATRDAQPGAALDVRVMREKKEVDLKVTLPERDEARPGVWPA
jgi:serine protease Do